MSRIILFNKPCGVLCQFSPQAGFRTLADFIDVPGVYPAGRLDADSEGLLVLTDDGPLQARISHPRHKLPKTYWVQVEGEPDEEALDQLRHGVVLKDGPTLPAQVDRLAEPSLWARQPPIRERRNIPTTWLAIVLQEGRNRQVRRMTAAVGYPTLRLVRVAVGPWTLDGLRPGEFASTTTEPPPLPPGHRHAINRGRNRNKSGKPGAPKSPRRQPRSTGKPIASDKSKGRRPASPIPKHTASGRS